MLMPSESRRQVLRGRVAGDLVAALAYEAATRERLARAVTAFDAARLDQTWTWVAEAGRVSADLAAALAEAQRGIGELSALEFDLRFAAESGSSADAGRGR